jgi:hypothetical protein
VPVAAGRQFRDGKNGRQVSEGLAQKTSLEVHFYQTFHTPFFRLTKQQSKDARLMLGPSIAQ